MFVSVQLKCIWRALQLSLKRLLAAWFFCVNQTTLYCWAGRISVEKLQLPDSYVLSKDTCVIIPLLHSQIADTFSALEPTPAWRLSTSRREWWSPLWKLKRSRGFPSNQNFVFHLFLCAMFKAFSIMFVCAGVSAGMETGFCVGASLVTSSCGTFLPTQLPRGSLHTQVELIFSNHWVEFLPQFSNFCCCFVYWL